MLATRTLLTSFILWLASPSLAHAQDPESEAEAELSEPSVTWHARVGFGLNPVAGSDSMLPQAHTGFGASISGFLQLPHRLSLGAGVDGERYTFDSSNTGDASDAPPRYTGEVLVHTRVMAQLQWDILKRRFITPFVLVGAGYGWEHATLTTWQCRPRQMAGPVVGAGAGVDFAINNSIALGVEYRVNTLPLGSRSCTAAFIPDEPNGAPSDFFSQRIGITFSVRR